MEFLKCRDVRWKGQEKRKKPRRSSHYGKNIPTHVGRFHATAGCNQGTCAVSHFGENLLPAAVSEPAVAICLNSLLCYYPNPSSTRFIDIFCNKTLGGRGYSKKFHTGRLRPKSNPLPFYIYHFFQKRHPFRIPFIGERHPFHIPS